MYRMGIHNGSTDAEVVIAAVWHFLYFVIPISLCCDMNWSQVQVVNFSAHVLCILEPGSCPADKIRIEFRIGSKHVWLKFITIISIQSQLSCTLKQSSYAFLVCYHCDWMRLFFFFFKLQYSIWNLLQILLVGQAPVTLWSNGETPDTSLALLCSWYMWKTSIELLKTSHNAPVPYPTMHHFVTEICTYLLQNVALWDICLMHCGICEMDSLLYLFRIKESCCN